jgi:epsilon-lactone hydrolase
MASRGAEELKNYYQNLAATLAAKPNMPLDELRLLFEHWGDVTAEPGSVDYLETDAGGVPALWAVPKNCVEDCVVLCTHGGGYVVASMYTHRKVYGHLAKAIGCRALIPHYRRAPEHVHPAPVDDAATAYEWLLGQGMAARHIALTAGGALAVTTLLRARQRGLPMPAATMPLSPWVDMEMTGETMVSNREKDVLVQKEVVETMAATFLGEAGNRRDPLANPLYADLSGLPPIYIQVGGDETLLDDSRRLAERARNAGVEVTLDIVPEMQHVFQFAAGYAPEADDAIRRLARWLRPQLGLA